MELKRRRSKTFIIDKHKYLYKQDKSQMALFQLWQAGVLQVLLPLVFRSMRANEPQLACISLMPSGSSKKLQDTNSG